MNSFSKKYLRDKALNNVFDFYITLEWELNSSNGKVFESWLDNLSNGNSLIQENI